MVVFASQGLSQSIISSTFNIDTITNADTIFTPSVYVKAYGDAEFAVSVDSISGATAGTIYYQGSVDGTTFFDLATDAINGAGVTTETYSVSGGGWAYYRMKFITSGTQSTAVSPFFVFKRRN